MEFTLTMTFVCSNGEKSSISVSGINKAVSSNQVNELMDTIIAQNVFTTKNGDIVKKYGATFTSRQVSKFDLGL